MATGPDTSAGMVSHREFGQTPPGYTVEYVSEGGVVLNKALYGAACLLRAAVYIDQKGFLTDEDRREDGTEHDEYDTRSTHVVVAGTSRPIHQPTVFGTMRFIERGAEGLELPMEHYYAGHIDPLAPNAVEGSRYIASHPHKPIQAGISLSLVASFLGFGLDRGAQLGAIIEAPLFRHLGMAGLAIKAIGDPRVIAEYGDTVNIPVVIDAEQTLAKVNGDPARYARTAGFFTRALYNRGAGPLQLGEIAA